MKYKDLLEFCQLVCATEADETVLATKHVLKDGYIAKVWEKMLESIKQEKDFDYRTYLEEIIAVKQIPKKLLH